VQHNSASTPASEQKHSSLYECIMACGTMEIMSVFIATKILYNSCIRHCTVRRWRVRSLGWIELSSWLPRTIPFLSFRYFVFLRSIVWRHEDILYLMDCDARDFIDLLGLYFWSWLRWLRDFIDMAPCGGNLFVSQVNSRAPLFHQAGTVRLFATNATESKALNHALDPNECS
jgi:hypothetical protein